MSSVLVTGGAGSIGSHAVKALRAQATRVVVFDNLSAGHRDQHASAHLLSLAALRSGAQSTQYNLGNGRPTSVKAVIDSVERVVGRTVPYTRGPRRPGDPGVLFASSERIRRELGWPPKFENIDVIVSTACRWREAHPHGYRKATA
jgi:UDP-glucose 4-epimerase